MAAQLAYQGGPLLGVVLVAIQDGGNRVRVKVRYLRRGLWLLCRYGCWFVWHPPLPIGLAAGQSLHAVAKHTRTTQGYQAATGA